MRIPLELPPGVISDDTHYASKGRWEDADKARFVDGRPETIGGWASGFGTALTGKCRNILSWVDNLATQNYAFGTHSKLYVLRNNNLYDLTPSDLTAGREDAIARTGYGEGGYGEGPFGGGPLLNVYPRTWSFATYGDWLIANPRGQGIYVWERDITAIATAVPNAPAHCNAVIVTPQAQLLALGTLEESDGDFNTRCIRGTDLQDIEDWTTNSDDNAFENVLYDAESNIVTGKLIGNFVGIWTEAGLHIGQFVGLPDQAYKFDLVANDCGLIGPNAITVSNGTAYWMTPDLQFFSWDPSRLPSPVPCPISDEFRDNLTLLQREKIIAAQVSEFDEIWWFYPDGRDGDGSENSRYLTLCVGETKQAGTPVWTRGTMERLAFIDSGPQRYPVGVDDSGNIWLHENGNDAGGSPLAWHIKSSGFYLAEGERRVLLRGMWPDFEGQQGDVTLTLYARDYPQSTEAAFATQTLTTATVRSDFMHEGRVFSMKLSGSADPSYTRLGKPLFDVLPTGEI